MVREARQGHLDGNVKELSWQQSARPLFVVTVWIEMCNYYVFDVKHLKWKIMPEGTQSGDDSKKKEALVVGLLLITSHSLRFIEVQFLIYKAVGQNQPQLRSQADPGGGPSQVPLSSMNPSFV